MHAFKVYSNSYNVMVYFPGHSKRSDGACYSSIRRDALLLRSIVEDELSGPR